MNTIVKEAKKKFKINLKKHPIPYRAQRNAFLTRIGAYISKNGMPNMNIKF